MRKTRQHRLFTTRAGAAFIALAMMLSVWPGAYAMDCARVETSERNIEMCEPPESSASEDCDTFTDECCCIDAATPIQVPVQTRVVANRDQSSNATFAAAATPRAWYVLPDMDAPTLDSNIAGHVHGPPLHLSYRSLLI